MVSLYNFRWLLLHFLFLQFHLKYVKTEWPSANLSSIRLLGLFPDAENTTETTEVSIHSRAMFKAAVLLSQEYNITIESQYIEWESAQTGGNVMNALGDTCQAVSSSTIVGIVGPALSNEAHQIADFGNKIGIPVISYSATDPNLSDRNSYPTFYRTVPSDNVAASAIVKLFLKFNWTSCVIIHQNDAFGIDGAHSIGEAFLNQGLKLSELIIFDISTLQIRGDLRSSLVNSPTRIVIVWANINYTSLILENALDCNVLGPRFTWILSSSISLTSFNQTTYPNLIGILTMEPVTGDVVGAPFNSTLLNAAYEIWKQYEPETFPASMKVNPYALFSFDATWILIQSLQQFCSTTENSSSSFLSFIGSSFCFDRYFVHSNLLLKTINSLEFLGVSGPIRFNVNTTDRSNGSYYFVQNVQSLSNKVSFVPVLQYSDPGNWNIYPEANEIIWPGNSLVPPAGRASLEGVTLRIGVIQAPAFTIVTSANDGSGGMTMNLTGYTLDLIELLRSQLKFIPDIQLAPSNQTYAGLIQAVANGVYDIVVGDVTVTAARRELVDFSNSIFDNSLQLIVRKTFTGTPDPFSFLKPFSLSLWLTFLCAWICGSVVFWWIERDENEMLQNRSIISQITASMWYCFGHSLGCDVDFEVRTTSGHLLTVGLHMLSLVLIASYTANLASDLTIMKTQNILSGVSDLKNGKIPANRIGIRVGTAAEDYYLKEISNGNQNFYPLQSRQELYDALLAGIIDVSFTDIGVGEYVTNNIYCNLTLIGDDFDTGIFGIVVPNDWIYTEELDINILSLGESGLLDNLQVKWFQTKICPDITDTPTAIQVGSMGGLFSTFAVIIILSLLLFAWKKRCILKNYLSIIGGGLELFFRKKTYNVNQSDTVSNQIRDTSFPLSTM